MGSRQHQTGCTSVRNYTSHLHQIFCAYYPRQWLGPPLCTSDLMDDVIFAHKPRLLDVAAQLKRSAHAALGLAMSCAQYYQLQVNGRTGLVFGRLK